MISIYDLTQMDFYFFNINPYLVCPRFYSLLDLWDIGYETTTNFIL